MYICMFSIKLEICERIVEMEKKTKKNCQHSETASLQQHSWFHKILQLVLSCTGRNSIKNFPEPDLVSTKVECFAASETSQPVTKCRKY